MLNLRQEVIMEARFPGLKMTLIRSVPGRSIAHSLPLPVPTLRQTSQYIPTPFPTESRQLQNPQRSLTGQSELAPRLKVTPILGPSPFPTPGESPPGRRQQGVVIGNMGYTVRGLRPESVPPHPL